MVRLDHADVAETEYRLHARARNSKRGEGKAAVAEQLHVESEEGEEEEEGLA